MSSEANEDPIRIFLQNRLSDIGKDLETHLTSDVELQPGPCPLWRRNHDAQSRADDYLQSKVRELFQPLFGFLTEDVSLVKRQQYFLRVSFLQPSSFPDSSHLSIHLALWDLLSCY
jgi:hypothetical protein